MAATLLYAANEITAQATLRVSKGSFSRTDQTAASSFSLTASAVVLSAGAGAASTTAAAIGLGSVPAASAGWSFFRNNATNGAAGAVEVGCMVSGEFVPFASLPAGAFALVPLSTNAPYVRSTVEGLSYEWSIYQD
jgi:hypothetical protein